MRYITGIHALNLSCELETTGDWHTSALKWEKIDIRDSEDSIFGEWGIKKETEIPNKAEKYPHANHIRAILDIMEKGNEYQIRWLKGFRNEFICTEIYDEIIFGKVYQLKGVVSDWELINKLMGYEYRMKWVNWIRGKEGYEEKIKDEGKDQLVRLKKQQRKHLDIIRRFMTYINKVSDDYILKGGTALMLCYDLDRFSEDIDLDGFSNDIENLVESFCNKYKFEYRVAEDTKTVKRYMIHYNGYKPLKVEVSYRETCKEDIIEIKGILVYDINRLCIMKVQAYNNRDRLRDLYDVVFIGNNYYNYLEYNVAKPLREALKYKGLDYFDYLVETQEDKLIDINKMEEGLLALMEKLGLL